MIEARVATIFSVIESRFLIYNLNLEIRVDEFVIAKRMIGAIHAEEVPQTTSVVDRSKEKSPRTAGQRAFLSHVV
jgi:hypothetical protein